MRYIITGNRYHPFNALYEQDKIKGLCNSVTVLETINQIIVDCTEDQKKRLIDLGYIIIEDTRVSHQGLDYVLISEAQEVQAQALMSQINDVHGITALHNLGLTGMNVPVALLDSGVDDSHPALVGRVIVSKFFVEDSPMDNNGHGTAVAGIIAGYSPRDNYVGVAPNALIGNYKILDAKGEGTVSSALMALNEAVVDGFRIINMSFGAQDLGVNDPLRIAVRQLAEKGIVCIAAVGNDPTTILSPASEPLCIGVGAVDINLNVAPFSGRGPTVDGNIKPDVACVGVNVQAPLFKSTDYVFMTGTSFATPIYTGDSALFQEFLSSSGLGLLTPTLIFQTLPYTTYKKAPATKDNDTGYGPLNEVNLSTALQQRRPTLSSTVLQFVPIMFLFKLLTAVVA
jgi:subtilisin family serine protease